MKQDISTYKVDSFIDYAGKERLVFNLAMKGFNFSKYIDLAKVYVRKIVKYE